MALEFTVYLVTSRSETFLTNDFLLETTESLIAVDAMMTVSNAQLLRRCADALGKPPWIFLIYPWEKSCPLF